ncbi:MAG: DUF1653 domain-containing protein [Candidatus Aenigmarchaeota archaeon]|nr:DUF1653 domain-containing protein [Candidatus Aenigmarchaeota archaeon]
MRKVRTGTYKHFKGGIYEVIGTARHTETMEELILYRDLKKSKLWVRPKDMFFQKVVANGKELPRFEFVR